MGTCGPAMQLNALMLVFLSSRADSSATRREISSREIHRRCRGLASPALFAAGKVGRSAGWSRLGMPAAPLFARELQFPPVSLFLIASPPWLAAKR